MVVWGSGVFSHFVYVCVCVGGGGFLKNKWFYNIKKNAYKVWVNNSIILLLLYININKELFITIWYKLMLSFSVLS
jgi:hypothetical protein